MTTPPKQPPGPSDSLPGPKGPKGPDDSSGEVSVEYEVETYVTPEGKRLYKCPDCDNWHTDSDSA